MQYVGRAIGSVSKTWNSINPATLSGAIDVIVIEQEDGAWREENEESKRSNLTRRIELFSFPCTVWKVLITSSIPEKGELRRTKIFVLFVSHLL